MRDGASAPAATLRMFDARHGTAGRAHLRAQMQRARWSAGARHGRGGDSGRVCSSPPPPLPASCAFRVGTQQRHGSAGERRSGGGGSEGARATHPALGRRGLEPARQGGRRLTDRLRGERHGCLQGALRDRAVAPPPPCAHARREGDAKYGIPKLLLRICFVPIPRSAESAFRGMFRLLCAPPFPVAVTKNAAVHQILYVHVEQLTAHGGVRTRIPVALTRA